MMTTNTSENPQDTTTTTTPTTAAATTTTHSARAQHSAHARPRSPARNRDGGASPSSTVHPELLSVFFSPSSSLKFVVPAPHHTHPSMAVAGEMHSGGAQSGLDDVELGHDNSGSGSSSSPGRQQQLQQIAEEESLHDSASPFAARRGKHLWFQHVSLEIVNKNSSNQSKGTNGKTGTEASATASAKCCCRGKTTTTTTTILKDCWGTAPAGAVTAIMGASGSGKTSLLNVLSGRMVGDNKSDSNKTTTTTTIGTKLTLQMKLNDTLVDPSDRKIRKQIAFVAQEDSLPVTATPREAILFSARLRLPSNKTLAELQDLTETMLEELRLHQCASTMIGGHLFKGISGGERKRTSVGVELVTQPSLIFADEPTSGLDSFNAVELVSVLKKVALAGSAVLLTIHQPSSEIFFCLDNLILLQQGRVMYGGGVQEVPQFLQERGYPCPAHYNPAEWILNIAQTVSIEELQTKGFFALPTTTTIEDAATSSRRPKKQTEIGSEDTQHVGFFVQTRLLFLRELVNVKRNKKNLAARTAMTTLMSTLGGIIFFQVAKTDMREFINIQSTFGGLLMALLANVFSTALPSLVAFPEERPVFIREYSTNHYGVPAYFASRLTMEIVVTACQVSLSCLLTYFLIGFSANFGVYWSVCYVLALTSTALGVLVGCAVKDPGMAVEFLPMIFMPQILFAGFFVPPELIPVWLRWLAYIFPLTYAVKLGVVAQFEHACDGLVPNRCYQIMNNVQAYPDDTWWYWIVLVGQFVFFRLVALALLRQKASRFY